MGKQDPAPNGTVWIAEDHDPDSDMMLTGRFSGYLERGERPEEEFEGLTADEAIAWGRKRAAVVLIRAGDSGYCSAGEHNPDPEELPSWPPPGVELERRRPRGLEALDTDEGDPPVLWDVRAEADLSGEVAARLAAWSVTGASSSTGRPAA